MTHVNSLQDDDDVQAAVTRIELDHRGVDVLINNAGFGTYGAMLKRSGDGPYGQMAHLQQPRLCRLSALQCSAHGGDRSTSRAQSETRHPATFAKAVPCHVGSMPSPR